MSRFHDTEASTDGVDQPDVSDPDDLARRQRAIAAQLFGADNDAKSNIGRYRIRRHLGAGAMGVVYEGFDESLDRPVAVKLIRDATPENRHKTEARLHREAKAMARLSHPRVATIYEVGTHEGETFIAMEFVDGPTLRQWLSSPRTPREIVDIMVGAGEGLAAAHAVSIVHRDFKPENVLVGPGGAKVVDFGIAASDHGDAEAHPTQDVRADRLTATGAVAGTPAYMAPEQLAGDSATPSSDQYAFCVTLYEALLGQRPYLANSVEELRAAMRETPTAPKRLPERVAPHWIAAVTKGLSFEPTQRHADMRSLINALRIDPAAARRRLIAGTVAIGVVAVSGYAAARVTDEAPCQGPGPEIGSAWSDEAQSQLHDAFEATRLPYAAGTWEQLRARLDVWAGSWATMSVEVCEASEVHRTQTADVAELRRACLTRSLHQFEATLDVLRGIEGPQVEAALELATGLPTLDRCADVPRLREQIPPPDQPELAARVEDINSTLDRLEATSELGVRFDDDGIAEFHDAVTHAREAEYAPVLARALALTGKVEVTNQGNHDGEDALREALGEALAAGDDDRFASTAGFLGEFEAQFKHDPESGLRWLDLADGACRRLGDPATLRQQLLYRRGSVLIDLGRLDEAESALTASVELLRKRGASANEIIRNSMTIARVSYIRGDPAAALERLEALAALGEGELPPSHPTLLRLHYVTSSTLIQLGRWDAAERAAGLAIDGYTQLRKSKGTLLANALANLAHIHSVRARFDDAGELYERAIALVREDRPGSAAVDRMLSGLAEVRIKQGRPEEAKALAEEALELSRTHRGPDVVPTAELIMALAVVEGELGQDAQARAHHAEAIATFERAGTPMHPAVATAHVSLARIAARAAEFATAEQECEEAIAVTRKIQGGPGSATAVIAEELGHAYRKHGRLGDARLWLDRALADAKSDAQPDATLVERLDAALEALDDG